MIRDIKAGEARLTPGLFADRMEKNRAYLMELDKTALLQNFYFEAGLTFPGYQIVPNELMHWGWESPVSQLRGHFLGHFMSASAMLVAVYGDRELKAKLEYVVDELEKCQELNGDGWVGSIPEKYFDKLEKEDYIWSPQYTTHKTIMGLMHAYEYAGIEKAAVILDGLADWYIRWTDKVSKTNPHAVYSGEEGGMLEVWARLYELTGNQKYMTLAERYSEQSIFRKLLDGRDPLTNSHANASIPHAQGAARMYMVTGDKKYLDAAMAFWKCAVEDRESYCTGGQNSGEFWTPPHMLGQFINERTQEFCTVYNMVRLADYLFKFTGDVKYADYIEKNLYNGFLAQQNKNTGMPDYWLSMKPGSHKKWGSKTADFWCCHGTMVQAQTIYQNLCYYADDEKDTLIINQYIPSETDTMVGKCHIRLEQNVDMKYYNSAAFFDENDEGQMSRWMIRIKVSSDMETTLKFRMPKWLSAAPSVSIDGNSAEGISCKHLKGNSPQDGFEKNAVLSGKMPVSGKNVEFADGYMNVSGKFEDTEIRIFYPAALGRHVLSDMPEKAAYLEGPIVLAGITEEDGGIVDNADAGNTLKPVSEHTYENFPWLQSNYRAWDGSREVRFKPLYDVTDEPYTLYFTQK